jgi:hypothetical protein
MQSANFVGLRPLLLLATTLTLFACGGGGGGQSTPSEPPPPAPPPTLITASEAGRFLSQATFGPSSSSIDELVDIHIN